jgi:hypothetical protein
MDQQRYSAHYEIDHYRREYVFLYLKGNDTADRILITDSLSFEDAKEYVQRSYRARGVTRGAHFTETPIQSYFLEGTNYQSQEIYIGEDHMAEEVTSAKG